MAASRGFQLLRSVCELSIVRPALLSAPRLQLTCLVRQQVPSVVKPCKTFTTCSVLQGHEKDLIYNELVYPPQEEGEPRRPGEICGHYPKVKYSPKKLFYIASMIRGMSIDEALKQLSFSKHKGAHIIKGCLLELQEKAVDTNVCEYKSNLWIETSSVQRSKNKIPWFQKFRGQYIPKGFWVYSEYFVRLREGKPPEHYYEPPKTGHQLMEEYIKEQRSRTIPKTL